MRITSVFGPALIGLALTGNAQTNAPTKRPMAVDDCIQQALEHNLSLQIERFNPRATGFNLNSSYSPYDPVFRLSASERFNSVPGRIDPTTSLVSPPSENYTESFSPSIGATLDDGIGTGLSLAGNMTRSSGTSFPASFQYQDNAALTLTQPLLRGLWMDDARLAIQLNKKDLQNAELNVQLQIINIVTQVKSAYYELIFDRENIKVQEKALELADKLLSENKKRVEVGALAPLDEKQAESQVAARRADVINAYATYTAQQNTLKSLISDNFSEWNDINIDPTDALLAIPTKLDVQESWQLGMAKRIELLQAKNDLEKKNITLKYSFNQMFPQLDLTASYGNNGLGNTLDGALNNIQRGNNQAYSAGLVLSVPLANTFARSKYKQNRELLQQQLLVLKKQEQDVLVAIDNAVKSTRTYYQRIDATRQARLYAEAALEAEQKKLESGKSTSFVVLQLQRDLTNARSDEIRALADYNKSLTTLDQQQGTTIEKSKIQIDLK